MGTALRLLHKFVAGLTVHGIDTLGVPMQRGVLCRVRGQFAGHMHGPEYLSLRMGDTVEHWNPPVGVQDDGHS